LDVLVLNLLLMLLANYYNFFHQLLFFTKKNLTFASKVLKKMKLSKE